MKRKVGGWILGKQLAALPQTGRRMGTGTAAAQGQPQKVGIDLRHVGVFISLH